MTNYTLPFISFSKMRMETQGDEIRKWANTATQEVAELCQEIIEAARQGAEK